MISSCLCTKLDTYTPAMARGAKHLRARCASGRSIHVCQNGSGQVFVLLEPPDEQTLVLLCRTQSFRIVYGWSLAFFRYVYGGHDRNILFGLGVYTQIYPNLIVL